MSHNNYFPIVLQCHTLTLACSCAYRSSHFAVAIETRVQAAVRVIAHESKSIDTADVGITRDYNLSITLRRHTVGEGASASSDGCMAEGGETCACIEAEEPRGIFHFTHRDARGKNYRVTHRNRQKVKCQPFSDRSDK